MKVKQKTVIDHSIAADFRLPRPKLAPLGHRRSLAGAVADGWRIFAYRPLPYLKAYRLAALLTGVGLAGLLLCLTRFTAYHVLPAFRAVSEMGQKPDVAIAMFEPTGRDNIVFGLLLLLSLLCLTIGKGRVWAQIAFFKHRGRLPFDHSEAESNDDKAKGLKALLSRLFRPCSLTRQDRQALRRGTWTAALRWFVWTALTLVLALVPIAVFAAVAWWSGQVWVWLAALPFVVVIYSMSIPGRYDYVVAGCSLTAAGRAAIHSGWKHLGGYFLTALLTGIPLAVAWVVFLLPAVVMGFGFLADGTGVLTTDPSGMPDCANALFVVVAATSVALCYVTATMQTWALALKSAGVESGR